MVLTTKGNDMPTVKIEDGQVTKVGLWHGTVIKLRDGKRYKVTKLNPVNVKLMDESGKTGYTYNRDAAERHIDTDQSWNGPDEKNPYELLTEALAAGLHIGAAVKFSDENSRRKYPETYVVCSSVNAEGKVRLAKLGGDNGRYFPGVLVSKLVAVEV
jgi:hypothetical protein